MEFIFYGIAAAAIYLVGVGYAIVSPNAWDDCWGEARQTENWCQRTRCQDAENKAYAYFRPFHEKVCEAKTEDECDKIFATVSYAGISDKYEITAYRLQYKRLYDEVSKKKKAIVRAPELIRQESAFRLVSDFFNNSMWSNVVEACSAELLRQKSERGAKEGDGSRFLEYREKAEKYILEENIMKLNEQMYQLGSVRSAIRELFEYGKQQAKPVFVYLDELRRIGMSVFLLHTDIRNGSFFLSFFQHRPEHRGHVPEQGL